MPATISRKDFTPWEALEIGEQVGKQAAKLAKAAQKEATGGGRRSAGARKEQGRANCPTSKSKQDASTRTTAVAADGLAKSQALADYGKRIKATTEEVNSIQYGKLLLAAKVGELCPKEKRGPKPKGVNHPAREELFHANSLTFLLHLAARF